MAGDGPSSTTIGKTPRRRRRPPKSSSADKENDVKNIASDSTTKTDAETKARSRRSREEPDLLSVDDCHTMRLQSHLQPSHLSAADFALQNFHKAQQNAPASDVWGQHSSLAECVVLASQKGSKSTKGILLLEEHSVEILNACRKCLKEATSKGKDKYSCLYVATHGLRAVCPLLTKQTSWDAALKFLYHAVTLSADSCAEKNTEAKWNFALICLAAFQGLANLLTGHCMKREGQKEIYFVPQYSSPRNFAESFPLPSTEKIETASPKGSLPPKQIFKICIQSIMAVGKVLLQMTTFSSRTLDEDSSSSNDWMVEFGNELGNMLRRHGKEIPFRNCLRIFRDAALPWITFFIRAEGDTSFEDALSYGKQIHRSLWDAAAQADKLRSLQKGTGDEALELRKYAIFALLLHGKKGSPSGIRKIIRNKSFDYACSVAWKTAASYVQARSIDTPINTEAPLFNFHTHVGRALDVLAKSHVQEESCASYVEYCCYRAIHLGVHKVNSQEIEGDCSRSDCLFTLFEPSYMHRMCMRDASSVTLGVIFLVQQLRQDMDDFIQDGVSSEDEVCIKEGHMLEDICNSVISRFRLIFFKSKEMLPFEVRLRCYKLLSLLSLHRVAFNVTKQIETEQGNCRRGSKFQTPAAFVGRFAIECIGPLALDLAKNCSDEVTSARINREQLLEVATEYHVRAASLFDRLLLVPADQTHGFSEKDIFASLANHSVDSLYDLIDELSNHKVGSPVLVQNLVEKLAKTLAGIGRRRLDAQEKNLALLPLIYSTNLFIRLSMMEDSKSCDRRRHQIPVRFAHIASVFHSLGLLDNACLALLAAIRHETLERIDNQNDDECVFQPLLTISRYANGILPIGCSYEGSIESKTAFTSRLVSIYLERQKLEDSHALPVQALCVSSPSCLVEILISSVKSPSSEQNILGYSTLSEILQVVLLGPCMRDEIILYDENLAAAQRLNVLLEAIVYLGNQIQRTPRSFALLQEFNQVVQVAFSIIDGEISEKESSVVAMLKASLSVAASTSLISSTHLLDFQHGACIFDEKRAIGPVFDMSCELAESAGDYLVDHDSHLDVHQVLLAVLRASLGIFCLQISEAKNAADGLDAKSTAVLFLCHNAADRVCEYFEWNTYKNQLLEDLASNFSLTLARLEVNFISKGDKLHSAELANLALRLTRNSAAEEKIWHCATIGSALMEAGLHRLAKEILNTVELNPDHHSATTLDLRSLSRTRILETELKAIMLRIDTRNFASDVSDAMNYGETMLSFLSDETGDSDLLVLWVRSTVNMALSDSSSRYGDVLSSLQYLQSAYRICQNAFNLTGRHKRITQDSPGNSTILPFLHARFTQRRVECLRQMAIFYSNLGDHRKSESHMLSAIDLSQLHLPVPVSKKLKFSDILPSDSSATRTIQQLECYRMLLKLKAYASAADVVSQDMANKSTAPGIFSLCQDESTHDLNQLHWNIEEILNLVTHGDLLYQDSNAEEKYDYALLYVSATEVAHKMISNEHNKPLLESFSTFENLDQTNLQYFDTLSCHLKLREARLLMATEKSGQVGEKAESLCNEIAKSPYASKSCRAWAFYYLGLAELEKSRRNGSLKALWRNFSISAQSSAENDRLAKEEEPCDKSLRSARYYFKHSLLTLDSAVELLARDAMRCLALVTGPQEDLKMFGESCAVLVHSSVGSTSRKNVSRAYSSNSERFKIGDIFVALDASFKKPSERNEKVIDLFKEANRLLPPTWRFLAACLCPTGEILLSSLVVSGQNDANSPLKTEVACIFPGDTHLDVHNELLVPLDNLIRRSQEQLHGLSESTAAEHFRQNKAKREWWKERQDFDDHLKSLLERAESKYFGVGCIKRLFAVGDRFKDETTTCKPDMDSSFDSSDSTGFSCGNLASKFEAACAIDDNEASIDVMGTTPERVTNDRKSFERLKVPEIKELLKHLDVESSKMRKLRKSELIDLLISLSKSDCLRAQQAEQQSKMKIQKSTSIAQSRPSNQHLFLILDEHFHQFPFEGMDFLAENSVSRIPSLSFALAVLLERSQASQDLSSDESKLPVLNPVGISFVVDPEANLKETNKRIVPAIQDMHSANSWKWKGVIGSIPTLEFMEEALTNQNGMFLYCGHGGGQSFFSRGQLNKLLHGEQLVATQDSEDDDNHERLIDTTSRRRCRSTVILMGCSSGKLESVNRKESMSPMKSPIFYEPEGIVLSYLCAGAPCVIGNLWDVTDRDIDRYCLELLQSFFASEKKISLAQCVANARSACKMRYIVGCAPVYYGVPVLLKEI